MANSAHRLAQNLGLGGIKTSFIRLGDSGSAQSTTDVFIGSGTGVPSGAYNLTTGATAIYIREDAGTPATWAYVTVDGGTNWTALGPKTLSTGASAAITTTRTLTAADSGGVFSVAKTSAYAITLPTPAQGLDFTFMVLDTGANAVTISNGSAHLFGNINEAGTVPIAMTGTTLSLAASGSVGDWVRIQGIDATHYLVTGTSIAASKITIA